MKNEKQIINRSGNGDINKVKIDMKRTELKRNALRGVVMITAWMFAASLLTTGCGTRRAAPDYAYETHDEAEAELPDDCALLHIYRPKTMVGMAISYTLHLDDEALCRVRNNSRTTVEVTGEGWRTLWARTETREELPIDIELGKEYYIRCTVGIGVVAGRPRIEIVDKRTGRSEFGKIKKEM
jgi:hypothetical protein